MYPFPGRRTPLVRRVSCGLRNAALAEPARWYESKPPAEFYAAIVRDRERESKMGELLLKGSANAPQPHRACWRSYAALVSNDERTSTYPSFFGRVFRARRLTLVRFCALRNRAAPDGEDSDDCREQDGEGHHHDEGR